MKKKITNLQIGKNGLTENMLKSIKNAFNTHENVRISILKSATRNRDEIKKIAQEICKYLGNRFTSKILGFTIFIKKWRKPMR